MSHGHARALAEAAEWLSHARAKLDALAAAGDRHVRTQGGVKQYGQPIGARITRDLPDLPEIDLPNIDDLGDSGDSASREEFSAHVPPAVGPNRPCDPQSTMSKVAPEHRGLVNNAGGTLDDPVLTHGKGGKAVTARQSDIEEHFREVLRNAIQYGQPFNPKVSPESLVGSKDWYRTARNEIDAIAAKYGQHPHVVAAVVSALSPQQKWETNIAMAVKVLEAHRLDPEHDLSDTAWIKSISAQTEPNTRMALRILHGEPISVLTGTKRMSFVNNLIDQENDFDVTVDGWMAAALFRMGLTSANGDPVNKSTGSGWLGHKKEKDYQVIVADAGYLIMADALRNVAVEFDLKPHEAQAVYWTSVGGGSSGTAMWSDLPFRYRRSDGTWAYRGMEAGLERAKAHLEQARQTRARARTSKAKITTAVEVPA